MSRKKILLTGAAGRVGQLLRPVLREKYALRLCDRAAIPSLAGDEEFLRGDLADPELARTAVAGTAGVVHLAGLVSASVSFEDTLAPNYRAVLALLDACRDTGVRRFIFASSNHIVGLHPLGPMTTQTPLAPDGFYGLSKAFGEAACALYSQRFGLACLILRIGNADAEVADGRRERLWISARDLAQLISIGLEREGLGCEIVHGVSQCPEPVFPIREAARLGYQPEDTATAHHAANFRPLSAFTAADGAGYVGGFFAVAPLPRPFERTV